MRRAVLAAQHECLENLRVMRSPGSGATQALVLMGVVGKRKGRVERESKVTTPEEF